MWRSVCAGHGGEHLKESTSTHSVVTTDEPAPVYRTALVCVRPDSPDRRLAGARPSLPILSSHTALAVARALGHAALVSILLLRRAGTAAAITRRASSVLEFHPLPNDGAGIRKLAIVPEVASTTIRIVALGTHLGMSGFVVNGARVHYFTS